MLGVVLVFDLLCKYKEKSNIIQIFGQKNGENGYFGPCDPYPYRLKGRTT